MNRKGYYSERLSAERLKRVYEIASPRVKRYLQAEIGFVLSAISSQDSVLELGCGYGRALKQLAEKSQHTVGIDTSMSSLLLAKKHLASIPNCSLAQMDAAALGFCDGAFDVVLCIQNGISAFALPPLDLIKESVRVTKQGGKVFFSSYSEKFWAHRLEWFELQANKGLLGKIDYSSTRDGIIVCKDGFRAKTVSPDEFAHYTAELRLEAIIKEIDDSSLFCIITA